MLSALRLAAATVVAAVVVGTPATASADEVQPPTIIAGCYFIYIHLNHQRAGVEVCAPR